MAGECQTYLKHWKEQVRKSDDVSVKINFLKAARVIFDNAASVLRAACIAKDKSHGIAPPSKNTYGDKDDLVLEEIEFTSLKDHLEKALRKCDFKLRPEFMVCPGSAGNKKVVVLIAAQNIEVSISILPALNNQVFVRNCESGKKICSPLVKKVEGSNYYLDSGKEIKVDVSVYCHTDAWAAVDELRKIRNEFVGHPPSTSLSNDALKMMLEKVKEAYNKLMPAVRIPEDDCKKLINEFEEIREGNFLADKDVEEELKKLWNEKRYCQNFVEAIVDGLSDDVRNVKQELSTVTVRVENLKQELATVTEKLQQMDSKATKEKEELMQNQEELKRLIDEETKKREELMQKQENFEQALAKATTEIEVLMKNFEEFKRTLAEVTDRVEDLEDGHAKVKEEVGEIRTDVDKVKEEQAKEMVKTAKMSDDVEDLKRKTNVRLVKMEEGLVEVNKSLEVKGDQAKVELGQLAHSSWSMQLSWSSSTDKGGYVFVPEKLVQELAELRIAFAKFLCDYEEQFRHSPTIQVKFIKMMLQLFRKLLKSEDHSFQSLFRTLIEEKVSLFNTYYLKTFFTIFPDDIRATTRQLVKNYEKLRQDFMASVTVGQFKRVCNVPVTLSTLLKGKVYVKLKLNLKWDDETIEDLDNLIKYFGVPGEHFHLIKVEDGCTAVIWLCSITEVEQLKIAISEAADSLQTMGVLQVFIEEEELALESQPTDQPSRSAEVVVSEVDLTVLELLKKLNSSFSSMITDLLGLFVSYKCDLSKARLFLGSFCRDDKAFGHCNTFKVLLEKLQNHMDSFNIEQLEELVLYFNKKRMTKCIEKYKKERDVFLEKTTITDFKEAVVSIVDPAKLTQRTKITIKVSEHFACNQTLGDIIELVQKAIGIDYRFLVQMHAMKESVIMSWIFPDALSQKLEALIQKNVEVFKDTGVLEVTVAEKVVYTLEKGISTSSLEKVGLTHLSYEEKQLTAGSSSRPESPEAELISSFYVSADTPTLFPPSPNIKLSSSQSDACHEGMTEAEICIPKQSSTARVKKDSLPEPHATGIQEEFYEQSSIAVSEPYLSKFVEAEDLQSKSILCLTEIKLVPLSYGSSLVTGHTTCTLPRSTVSSGDTSPIIAFI